MSPLSRPEFANVDYGPGLGQREERGAKAAERSYDLGEVCLHVAFGDGAGVRLYGWLWRATLDQRRLALAAALHRAAFGP